MKTLHIDDATYAHWQSMAKQRHTTLAEMVRTAVQKVGYPSIGQAVHALGPLAPDEACRTAVQTVLRPLWPAVAPPVERVNWETKQSVRDRNALYARRFRRRRRYQDFGDRPGHWYLGVQCDAKKLPDGPSKDEVLARAYVLSKDDAPGWQDRFLDLFDPLDRTISP